MPPDDRLALYWARTLRMTGLLLAVWVLVTFVAGWFARELSFTLFGWPFSFYMAAQGALLVYLAIICIYSRYMNRLDREFGVEEPDD